MSTTQKRQRVPAANPTQSFWNATSKPLDEFRSSEELPPTADVVIIGSGLSGVATAYYLLNGSNSPQQQQQQPSIILLEARTTCSGATGRNGGHCKPDTYSDVPKFARLFGLKGAAQLAEFEAENVRALKSLVEEEDIDCDFHLTRATDVFLDPSHAQEVRDTYAKLSKLGIMNLADVAFTQEKDVERITGVKGAKGSLSYTAAHLWPSKLVQHLLLKLIDQGLNLQTRTSVSSVGPSGQESRPWSVNTCRGSIKARKVIHATNAYASNALPEYTHAITPVRGVCSYLASPKQAQTPHLVNTYGLRFNKVDNDYLVPRADGSIIVGGARQLFWHKKEQWFDITSDDELIKEASSYFDGYMQRHFRGWTDSGMETRKVWTGILGYSFDFMPHVGEVPGKQGQYIIAGFTGYGMPKILLCSKGLAGMVLNSSDFEATNLPRVFKTTRERNESTTSPLKESLKAVWDSEPKL